MFCAFVLSLILDSSYKKQILLALSFNPVIISYLCTSFTLLTLLNLKLCSPQEDKSIPGVVLEFIAVFKLRLPVTESYTTAAP